MATRNHPAVLEAEKRTGITGALCQKMMRVIDSATAEALAAEGIEAFRFDARRSPEEGWLAVTIKMRPKQA